MSIPECITQEATGVQQVEVIVNGFNHLQMHACTRYMFEAL